MKTNFPQPDFRCASARAGSGGFSLIEVMASVAMLAVIILGLVAMFGQTRRALTAGLTQVDYLESGRAAAGFIARDLEQAVPSYYSNAPNFYTDVPVGYAAPLVQPLPVAPDSFTNWIQEFYCLTKYNQTWNGVGYKVVFNDSTKMIGSLYRYSAPGISVTNNNTSFNMMNQAAVFIGNVQMLSPETTNRIIDGVVDFRVRLFDPHGQLVSTNDFFRNRTINTNINTGDLLYGMFTSNALPAYVEVELGVLEGRVYERYRALTNNTAAAQSFLAGHAAQVHVFRQRIPLRNVDPSAYP